MMLPRRVLIAFLMLASCDGLRGGTPEPLSPWPFAETKAVLTCKAGRVYVELPDGRRFGVNGSAKGDAPPVEQVTTHWDTQPMIYRGLKLCADGQSSVTLVPPPEAPGVKPDDAPGNSAVEAGERPFGGLAMRSNDAPLRARGRPEISVSCDATGKPFVFVESKVAPARAAPLSVPATLRLDGKKWSAPLAWGSDDNWSLRNDVDLRSLALAFARATQVELEVPGGFVGEPLRWRMEVAKADRDRFVRQCRRG